MGYVESMASLRLDSKSVVDMSDPNILSSSKSLDLSRQSLLSRRRHSTTSVHTFQTSSTSRTLAGLKTLRQVALGPLVFIPALARVAAAKKELAVIRRKSLPSPLFEQRKVLDELLQLSDDHIPRHIRKSALRILRRSFHDLIHDIYLPFGQDVYDCFRVALDELCCDSLASNLRSEDFYGFYYIVAAGANIHFKSNDLEKEDCRMVMTIARSSSLPALKLAGYVYVRVAWSHYATKDKNPVLEETIKEVAEAIFNMTWSLYPYAIRQTAVDQLWYLEHATGFESSLITSAEIRAVLAHVMDLIEDPEAPDNGLPALTRIWWFSSLTVWRDEFSKNSTYKRRIGDILLSYTGPTCAESIRHQTFQLLYRLTNTLSWSDIFDMSTVQAVSMSLAGFCFHEQQNDANKRKSIVREIRQVINEAKETTPLVTREVATITKRLDIGAVKVKGGLTERIASWMCIDDQLRNWESQAPSIDTNAMIENLLVFVLPDESLLDKDNFAAVYGRVRTYAQTISQTREIAVDALFILSFVRDWLEKLPLEFDGNLKST